MFRIGARSRAAEAVTEASPDGAELVALDEKSALVEIEAMRILRMDGKDVAGALCAAGNPEGASSGEAGTYGSLLPWSAKLAVATLVVLMIGTSM
jgi:hypothetical protein